VKYTKNGSLDQNFGNGGIEVDDVGVDVSPSGLVKLKSGKLLVVGPARTSPSTFVLGLVRFQAKGHPDDVFGPNGYLTRDYGGTTEYPQRAVLSGNRVLVATSHVDGTGERLGVARLMLNGAADTAFGDSGLAQIPTSTSYGAAVAVDAGDRILVAGSAGASDDVSKFTLARFMAA